MKKIITAIALSATLAACAESPPSAEQKQKEATNKLMADAEARVGMPRVTNFTEKRLANMILELRDQPNLSTYTYTIDMQGKAHCLGRSIGYGLPYTTQITNPQKIADYLSQGGYAILPQAEPNGLYSSDSTSATWVLLVGPTGKPEPTYVESDITVSLSPLRTAVEQCE
jgi:hypothetical protein